MAGLFDNLPNPEDVEAVMGVDTYALVSGCQVLRAEPGYAEVKMPVGPSVLNGHGNLHGGAMFTLADYASALASNLCGHPTMAVNASIQFMSAVRGGHVIAKATTVKNGKRLKFQTVDIVDADGRLVAVFQSGAMHVPRRDG